MSLKYTFLFYISPQDRVTISISPHQTPDLLWTITVDKVDKPLPDWAYKAIKKIQKNRQIYL